MAVQAQPLVLGGEGQGDAREALHQLGVLERGGLLVALDRRANSLAAHHDRDERVVVQLAREVVHAGGIGDRVAVVLEHGGQLLLGVASEHEVVGDAVVLRLLLRALPELVVADRAVARRLLVLEERLELRAVVDVGPEHAVAGRVVGRRGEDRRTSGLAQPGIDLLGEVDVLVVVARRLGDLVLHALEVVVERLRLGVELLPAVALEVRVDDDVADRGLRDQVQRRGLRRGLGCAASGSAPTTACGDQRRACDDDGSDATSKRQLHECSWVRRPSRPRWPEGSRT